MKVIEQEGKTTTKIIESFMQENNLQLKDLKFDVVQEGASGFLGMFSSKKAIVKFYLPDATDVIENYLEELLKKLEIVFGEIKIKENKDNYNIEILKVDNAGFLIGKDARLLDSLEHLVNQMINKHEKKHLRISLDIDGYRSRKKNALIKKVNSIADKVKKRNKSITLEPLPASKRKIVHQLVEKDSQIRTMTIGDGTFKRVVIMPSSKVKSKNVSKRSNKAG